MPVTGQCMEMTLLFILMKYTRYKSYIIGLVHINIIVISTWKYTRYTSHITWLVHINIVVIGTWIYAVCSQSVMIDTWQLYCRHFAWAGIVKWWLNTKWTICMLQLIDDDHRPNAQFACYMYEYMMLALPARLHVMWLGQCYS